MDTVKSVDHQHSHLWLSITENCVLEVVKTQLVISFGYIMDATISKPRVSISTQTTRLKRGGWSPLGKSQEMFPSLDQMAPSYYSLTMDQYKYSWKVTKDGNQSQGQDRQRPRDEVRNPGSTTPGDIFSGIHATIS